MGVFLDDLLAAQDDAALKSETFPSVQRAQLELAASRASRLHGARGMDDAMLRCARAVERVGTEEEKRQRRQILRDWRACYIVLTELCGGRRDWSDAKALEAVDQHLRNELFGEEPVREGPIRAPR